MPTKLTALRYAQAAFALANEKQQTDKWLNDLAVLKTVMASPQVFVFFSDPRIPLKDKKELLKKNLPDFISEDLNFAYLLASKNLLSLAGPIYDEFEAMYNEQGGLATAEVTTAVELSEAEKQKVIDDLSRMFGKTINIITKVDPNILGGLVARVGDKLIDGSLRSKIDSMRRKLSAGII
ncbi:MAG: F0F1 ATP synthase subunit delta [Chloroflexi bacterium]|nr:F0F1 ATP synthase subunit delta [Chloroflexota bacterium]